MEDGSRRLAGGTRFRQTHEETGPEHHILQEILADPSALIIFALIGFAAQLVDGALGMAFGQISSTILISVGVPPAAASAGVHTAETFTTAVSAISHVAHKNVDWRLFFRLAIPGMMAGVLGAYVLTSVDASTAKPFVLVYLTSLGLYLFYRGVMHRHTERTPKIVSPLGFIGGFLDAAGGGGWGAIVTSNLLVQGSNPRKTIGTVNTAEFFLTITISATFLATFTLAGSEEDRQLLLRAIIGLVLGGVVAAPFGAMIAKRVNPDRLLTFVGALVTLTSTYALYRALS